jgi:hypothetical protein
MVLCFCPSQPQTAVILSLPPWVAESISMLYHTPSILTFIFFMAFFEVWALGLVLAKQALCHFSLTASPFCSVVGVFFGSGGGTGVWNWGLIFARQVLYHLSHSASPKTGYFELVAWLTSNSDLPDLSLPSTRIGVSHQHPARLFISSSMAITVGLSWN